MTATTTKTRPSKKGDTQQLKINVSYRDTESDKDLYNKVIRMSQLSHSTSSAVSRTLIREGLKNESLVEHLIGYPISVLNRV